MWTAFAVIFIFIAGNAIHFAIVQSTVRSRTKAWAKDNGFQVIEFNLNWIEILSGCLNYEVALEATNGERRTALASHALFTSSFTENFQITLNPLHPKYIRY